MTIKAIRLFNSNTQEPHLQVFITSESSMQNFITLINRGLNCWDSAPKELKDLGDMLSHGYVTQDHKYTPTNTHQSTDYYNPTEYARIEEYIKAFGFEEWKARVNDGTSKQIAAGKKPNDSSLEPSTPPSPTPT